MLTYDSLNTKQKILPFFPLGVFLIPGEDMPLRIFEPRYLQLIDEAREDGITFAIPFVKDDQILDYGCEVKLQQVVAENESGRKVITVESVSLIRVINFTSKMNGKLYAGGSVEVLPDPGGITDPFLAEKVRNYRLEYDPDFLKGISIKNIHFHAFIRALNLSSEEKYRIVHMNSARERLQFLHRQMEFLYLIRKQEKMLDNDFHLN